MLSSTFAFVTNQGSNNVSGYTLNIASGSLNALPFSPFTTGFNPVSIAPDPLGRFVYTVASGVWAYTINRSTLLSVVRNSGSYPVVPTLSAVDFHSAGTQPNSLAVDPTGRFVYVAASGSKNIWAYTISASTGALTLIPGSPFPTGSSASPTAITVDPTGRFAYSTNTDQNVAANNTISAYSIDSMTGALTPIPGSPFPTGSPAQASFVTVDPTGRFAYSANADRNVAAKNTISGYAIDGTTGALSPVPGSPFATPSISGAIDFPISIAVEPTGRVAYVANAFSNTVSAYSIDATTGTLSPVAGSPFATGSSPFSVAVDPTGHFAYVANLGSNSISGYTVNTTAGALSPVAGSPFGAGSGPIQITAGARFLPDLDALACTQEASLKSIQSSSATTIVFENYSTQDRQVYRLNDGGQRELVKTLAGGASYVQQTFLTNPWVITDSAGQCINIYLPTNGLGRVVIGQ
jgi:6-phosphogluconolactonase (cycloisomerase 2 family)